MLLKLFISVHVAMNLHGAGWGLFKAMYVELKVMVAYDGSQTLRNFIPWGFYALLESFALTTIVSGI